jgi:hypothetical protein
MIRKMMVPIERLSCKDEREKKKKKKKKVGDKGKED